MIRLPSEILTALETVIDYYWQDEGRHYEETSEDRDNHIFTSLKIVQAFVNSDDMVAVYPPAPPAQRHEVQTEMLGGCENCWTDGDGQRVTFATREEAEDAINDHVTDCIDAVDVGDMADSPNPTSLRVVEVEP